MAAKVIDTSDEEEDLMGALAEGMSSIPDLGDLDMDITAEDVEDALDGLDGLGDEVTEAAKDADDDLGLDDLLGDKPKASAKAKQTSKSKAKASAKKDDYPLPGDKPVKKDDDLLSAQARAAANMAAVNKTVEAMEERMANITAKVEALSKLTNSSTSSLIRKVDDLTDYVRSEDFIQTIVKQITFAIEVEGLGKPATTPALNAAAEEAEIAALTEKYTETQLGRVGAAFKKLAAGHGSAEAASIIADKIKQSPIPLTEKQLLLLFG